MGKNALFIALLVAFDGVALAWAAWEFWKARPSRAKTPAPLDPASQETPGHPEGKHGPDDG